MEILPLAYLTFPEKSDFFLGMLLLLCVIVITYNDPRDDRHSFVRLLF